MGIRCQITFLTQFVNCNVKILLLKILGKRLCSISLKDAAWLEDTQLIFIFPIRLTVTLAG